jgi:RNA-binding protein YhbY
MEEILKEILNELKEIRKELNKDNSDPIELKVAIGDDVVIEKVIEEINKQSRLSGKTRIVV